MREIDDYLAMASPLDRRWSDRHAETIGEWLTRHEIERDGEHFIFYHGTPKRGGATTHLRSGSYLATTRDEARFFAARDRGLKPASVVVYRLRLSPDDINPGVFATLRRDIALTKTMIVAAANVVAPVDWPTNLGWRIQLNRYAHVPSLTKLRENKVFALPFRNWVSTYWHLLGKDVKKLKFMPTKVVVIPDDALVADMAVIDTLFFLRGKSTELPPAAKAALEHYEASAISYAEFKKDPYVFSQPEILIEREALRFVPGKIVPTAVMDPDEAMPTPLLGIKT